MVIIILTHRISIYATSNMEYQGEEQITHYSAVNDKPEVLLKFVDKFVELKLGKVLYSGFVHSIDPVSHSVILSVPCGDSFQTTLFPGCSITDITEIKPESDLKAPPRKKASEDIPIEEIIKKKRKVIAWFHQNLLPVTEAGNNIVVGSASILPPYTVMDICADNPVVSLQLKNIIANMPPDFEPK